MILSDNNFSFPRLFFFTAFGLGLCVKDTNRATPDFSSDVINKQHQTTKRMFEHQYKK